MNHSPSPSASNCARLFSCLCQSVVSLSRLVCALIQLAARSFYRSVSPIFSALVRATYWSTISDVFQRRRPPRETVSGASKSLLVIAKAISTAQGRVISAGTEHGKRKHIVKRIAWVALQCVSVLIPNAMLRSGLGRKPKSIARNVVCVWLPTSGWPDRKLGSNYLLL